MPWARLLSAVWRSPGLAAASRPRACAVASSPSPAPASPGALPVRARRRQRSGEAGRAIFAAFQCLTRRLTAAFGTQNSHRPSELVDKSLVIGERIKRATYELFFTSRLLGRKGREGQFTWPQTQRGGSGMGHLLVVSGGMHPAGRSRTIDNDAAHRKRRDHESYQMPTNHRSRSRPDHLNCGGFSLPADNSCGHMCSS